ncbi:hypothetical protein, partial [Nostoc sp.]
NIVSCCLVNKVVNLVHCPPSAGFLVCLNSGAEIIGIVAIAFLDQGDRSPPDGSSPNMIWRHTHDCTN